MEKSSQSGHVGIFAAELEKAKDQITIDAFQGSERAQAEEIAALIAEMYCLPEEARVQISKIKMLAGTVAEIYSMLQYEHVRNVIDSVSGICYPVKHVKTYLRTALYNAAFESEFKIQNEFNQGDKR